MAVDFHFPPNIFPPSSSNESPRRSSLMSTHSTSSYSLSLLLHGAFIAALVFTAFAFKENAKNETTKIFELVAGAGDNWGATEAPAIGTPDGVKFQPSAKPVMQPKPEPVAPPQPEPVAASPVEPSPVVATVVEPPVKAPKVEPKKTTPPQKTFAQQVEQVANRKEKQLMTKYRREEQARAKKEADAEAKRKAAEAAAAKKMSYDEFSKANPKKVASNTKSGTPSYEKVSAKGLAGGVDGGTTDKPGADGKVLSRAEQDQLSTYFAFLKQKVKDAHVTPLGVTNQPSARVSFHVSAGGTISQVKIIRSSGNTEFDLSVIAAFKAVGSIGARPDGRSDTHFTDFNTKDE
jgi:colicin import membrane protein